MTDEGIEQEMAKAGRIARLAERPVPPETADPMADRLAAGLRRLARYEHIEYSDDFPHGLRLGSVGPCQTCGHLMDVAIRLTCVPTGVCRWKERVAGQQTRAQDAVQRAVARVDRRYDGGVAATGEVPTPVGYETPSEYADAWTQWALDSWSGRAPTDAGERIWDALQASYNRARHSPAAPPRKSLP